MIVPWLADAWRTLAARIDDGRVAHALLIAGPEGLGKRAFAEALVASLLCTARDADGHACGTCRGCTLRLAGSHPDQVVVGIEEDATTIKIDQVRALSQRLSMTTQFGGWQVATIAPAEAMTTEAANALLKTLEEPSPRTVLILRCDHPARLPATIRSRCQRIDARYPPEAEALAWMATQGIAGVGARTALALAAGNPGVALALAGHDARQLLAETVDQLLASASGRVSVAEVAARWAKNDTEARLRMLSLALRTVAFLPRGAVAPEPLGALASLTATLDFPKLAAWWDRLNRLRDQLRAPLRVDLLVLELLRDFRALAPAMQRA